MILTGRAKEDFGNVCKYDYHEFIKLDEVIQHALIIEWFDSVGIYLTIGIYGYILNTDGIKVTKKTGDTRQEATKQAILKANEIYNESKN